MKQQDKVALWFVRAICGGILIVFLGHYGHIKLFTQNEIQMSGDEKVVLFVALGVWVAYEAIREGLKAWIQKK